MTFVSGELAVQNAGKYNPTVPAAYPGYGGYKPDTSIPSMACAGASRYELR